MRPPQKNNRPRGRGRGKSNGNSANRVYESTGPEGKVRGTPQQIIEKYLTLARDSQTSGDRVTAENFLQHAEHFQRILIQANAAQPQHEQRRDEVEEAAEGATVAREAGIASLGASEVNGLTTIDAPRENGGEGMLLEEDLPAGGSARRKTAGGNRAGDDKAPEPGVLQPEV